MGRFMKNAYVGKWRIVEMEEWDKDFVDLVVPGHFTFRKDGTGHFQFGAVDGEMDCRVETVGGAERIEFTWDGTDECDTASGRGWAQVEGKQMKGRIYFHLGDDSEFTAKKG